MDALSSWLEMAPGRGSSLASLKNLSSPFCAASAQRYGTSLRCACRLGGRRGGSVSGGRGLRVRGRGLGNGGNGSLKWVQDSRPGQSLRVTSPSRGAGLGGVKAEGEEKERSGKNVG